MHHHRPALIAPGAGDRTYRAFPPQRFATRHDLGLLDQPPGSAGPRTAEPRRARPHHRVHALSASAETHKGATS